MANKLFVDVQHGLSNRLRALASGFALAKATNRELFVVWCPDDHCEAHLDDLFWYSGPVISDRRLADAMRTRADLDITYMENEPNACFEAPLLVSGEAGDVYVRSAYSLQSPHIDVEVEHLFLRSLRPVAAVERLMSQVRGPFSVAAHIRMGTGPAFEHLSYESADNWPAHRHAEIVKWRENSHVDRFAKKLDEMLDVGGIESIFLAADLPESYKFLKERYGDRLRFLNRTLYDRSDAQLQYAAADLLLLSRANILLASNYSSFSDVAQRLAVRGRPILKSGIDF